MGFWSSAESFLRIQYKVFLISGQHLEIVLFGLRQLPDVCIAKFFTCMHVIIVLAHGRGFCVFSCLSDLPHLEFESKGMNLSLDK